MILRLRKPHLDPYSLPNPREGLGRFDSLISLAILLSVVFGVLVAALLLRGDSQTAPRVALEKDNWRISFSGLAASCKAEVRAGPGCPAAPESSLWDGGFKRDSKESLANQVGSSSYWMGIKVPVETLKRAAKESANSLILPKIHGDMDVWLDGVHQFRFRSADQRLPVVLQVPTSRLLKSDELSVALFVLPTTSYSKPETSSPNTSEGFFTPVEADRGARSTVFFFVTRYLIAAGLFLLLAGILWSMSNTSRTPEEFVVGAQFALLLAMNALVSMDMSRRVFTVANFSTAYFLLLSWEALFVVRYTAAILRLPGRRIVKPMGFFLVATFIVAYMASQAWVRDQGINLMASLFLPLAYAACALAIVSHILRLKILSTPISLDRFEFLTITAGFLGCISVFYLIEAHRGSGLDTIWSRWLNILPLYLLIRLFSRNHQTKVSLIEALPASKYHLLEKLPSEVEGWIVHLEVLKLGSDHQVMSTVISQLWTIAQLRGGEVIRTEHNSIGILFAEEQDGAECGALLQAMAEMSKSLRDMERRFQSILPEGSLSASFLFRAAVVWGKARPSWRQCEAKNGKIPQWQDIRNDGRLSFAGSTAYELLQVNLDSELRSNDASVVVIGCDDTERIQKYERLPGSARLNDAEFGASLKKLVILNANRLVGRNRKRAA